MACNWETSPLSAPIDSMPSYGEPSCRVPLDLGATPSIILINPSNDARWMRAALGFVTRA